MIIDFQIWLAAIHIYMLALFLIGLKASWTYLKSDPLKVAGKESYEALKQINQKQQESNVLTGFALVTLIFIITFFEEKIEEKEILLTFFSLAFVFEVISSMLYRLLTKSIFNFLGSLFQYGGILAMMMGFGNFMFEQLEWSFYLNVIFLAGIVVVIIISAKGLLDQIMRWKKLIAEKRDTATNW